MAMISWIIEELANMMSPQDGNIKCVTYHRTLCPAPATKRKTVNLSKRAKVG